MGDSKRFFVCDTSEVTTDANLLRELRERDNTIELLIIGEKGFEFSSPEFLAGLIITNLSFKHVDKFEVVISPVVEEILNNYPLELEGREIQVIRMSESPLFKNVELSVS